MATPEETEELEQLLLNPQEQLASGSDHDAAQTHAGSEPLQQPNSVFVGMSSLCAVQCAAC